MHLQQHRLAQRWRFGPRIVQLGEKVRVVGEDRGAAQDQRTFAAQGVVDAGPRQDARDQTAGLDVAFAGRERPRGGDQQARPTVELFGREPLEPGQHCPVVSVRHQRFVEAALDELVGDLGLPGGPGVARRLLEQVLLGEPTRGARMQLGSLVRGQRGESLPQRSARQGVHAHPLAVFGDDEDRSVARHPRQPLGGVAAVDENAAERGMEIVDERDAGQQREVLGRQVGEQGADELLAQAAAARRQRTDLGARVCTGRHHRQRELQPERPAFGELVQPRRRVVTDGGTEPAAHQGDRLGELEAKLRRADLDALTVVDEVVDAELAVCAGGDDDAQVGRRVAKQVRQRLDRRRRKAVGLVDDQHDVERGVGHLREPRGDAFEGGRLRRRKQRVAEARPPGAGANGERERVHQARRIVDRLRREPGDDRPARQMLAPPLREERRLAESGGSLHEDDRVPAHAVVGREQPFARDEVARHTRRRDLEQEVADAARKRRGHEE